MSDNAIATEREGNIRIIRLNRPNEANALNDKLCMELYDVINEYATDNTIKAVILTANGKMFCGGGDLKFLRNVKNIKSTLLKMTNYLHGAIARMAKMNAPVIVAVNGTAGGGGVSLAISGDIVVSVNSAKFTLAYTKAGLSPDASSTFYLPRLIGLRKAKELMLTNRIFSAKEAYEMGMIDRIVEENDLMDSAMEYANTFAKGATNAYGSVKKLLNMSFCNGLETQMDYEGMFISENGSSKDGQEGMLAFSEKRTPIFKG